MGKGSPMIHLSFFPMPLPSCFCFIVTVLLRFLVLDGYCSCGGQFESLPS